MYIEIFFILYLGTEKRCRANIGFLVDKSLSLRNTQIDGWKQTKEFIVEIAKYLNISEDETNVAVTSFGTSAELEIKFSENKDFLSFEKAVYAMNDDLGSTNTIDGFEKAFNEMFDEKNGMRIGVPNTMIYMTDGECSQRWWNCSKEAFQYWRNMYRNADPPIKLIGIGVGEDVNQTEIEAFVGEENYIGSDFADIVKPEFIRNLSICDGIYSYLVLILIRIQMEFVIGRTIFVIF